MLIILSLMQASNILQVVITCYTIRIYPQFMEYTSIEFKVTDLLSALAFASWSFAVWLLAFKYWQTAYEMNYLFRIHDDKLTSKKTLLYNLLNGAALILTIAAVICSIWVETP